MTRPLDHYCRTCRTALDAVTVDGVLDGYVHTLANEELWVGANAHDPDPVPYSEMDPASLLMRCDVDNEPPRWRYVFDFSGVPEKWRERFDSMGPEWALCDACAALVQACNVLGLTNRAVDKIMGDSVGPLSRFLAEEEVRPIYRILLGLPFTFAPLGGESNRSTDE